MKELKLLQPARNQQPDRSWYKGALMNTGKFYNAPMAIHARYVRIAPLH